MVKREHLKHKEATIAGRTIEVYLCNTLIVGSGASAYCAANRLVEFGQRDVLMISEGVNRGTSRNTGSDKQTYYKMSTAGLEKDSVQAMAQTLFAGLATDGDLALSEAANSLRCFYYLLEAGVEFPQNAYGEFPGYQTDHDQWRRATSIGPLTSKQMTECLQRKAQHQGIAILDQWRVVSLLIVDDVCVGVLAISLEDGRYLAINAKSVIYATGGPAGIYADSVYPPSQSGGSGVALSAGVTAKNFTEWQYGLASTKFRWNLSGTFQQVLPRYISTAPDLSDEREFLSERLTDDTQLLENIFLKGYQWPFDPKKLEHDGSSVIDLLVYLEQKEKGRRVFLDFTRNPSALGSPPNFSVLSEEPYQYLEQSQAFLTRPIDRLERMNPKAIELYANNGIDLRTELLEIAVCAQHQNGGLAVDATWQSNVEGFFAIGEVSGTHGVYRPGGSALNSGQVGALRATQTIAANRAGEPLAFETFLEKTTKTITETIALGENACNRTHTARDTQTLLTELKETMSHYCAHIRSKEGIKRAKEIVYQLLTECRETVSVSSARELGSYYTLYDHLITATVLIASIEDYIAQGGSSRGSYLIEDAEQSEKIFADSVQEILYADSQCSIKWRAVRPVPERELWFENVLTAAGNDEDD